MISEELESASHKCELWASTRCKMWAAVGAGMLMELADLLLVCLLSSTWAAARLCRKCWNSISTRAMLPPIVLTVSLSTSPDSFWLVQIILDSSIVLHHPLCPVCPPEGGVTFKQGGVGGLSAVSVKQDGGSRNWWALTCLYLTSAHFDLKAAFQKISISNLDQQSWSAPDKISLSQIVLHV